jgi:hypothetical protein
VHTPASLLTTFVVVVLSPSPPPCFFLCVSVGDHSLFELLLKCSFGIRLLKKFVPLFTRVFGASGTWCAEKKEQGCFLFCFLELRKT